MHVSESKQWNPTKSLKDLNMLKHMKREIIKELEPDVVLDYLFQYKQYSLDEYEEVITKATRKQKAKVLMNILATNRHMPHGYVILMKALKDSNQMYLYELLSESQKQNINGIKVDKYSKI